jgi:hypothetical protein
VNGSCQPLQSVFGPTAFIVGRIPRPEIEMRWGAQAPSFGARPAVRPHFLTK